MAGNVLLPEILTPSHSRGSQTVSHARQGSRSISPLFGQPRTHNIWKIQKIRLRVVRSIRVSRSSFTSPLQGAAGVSVNLIALRVPVSFLYLDFFHIPTRRNNIESVARQLFRYAPGKFFLRHLQGPRRISSGSIQPNA